MLSTAFAYLLKEKKITTNKLEEMLVKYHLVSLLPAILVSLHKLELQEKESDLIKIESPYSLSKETIALIKKELHATNSPHTVTIQEDLLLGYTATYKETHINKSARLHINTFLAQTNN